MGQIKGEAGDVNRDEDGQWTRQGPPRASTGGGADCMRLKLKSKDEEVEASHAV